MNHSQGARIEELIHAEKWPKARKLIQVELRKKPKDHWLLSRLALTYYEEGQYKYALQLELKALQEAPYCPLAIWGYAGTLEMLDRGSEALKIYKWLASWGEENLAYGDCGEGLRWARSLIADCHYRIACIMEKRGQRKRAIAAFQEYLLRRERGHRSIYSLSDVKRRYKRCWL